MQFELITFLGFLLSLVAVVQCIAIAIPAPPAGAAAAYCVQGINQSLGSGFINSILNPNIPVTELENILRGELGDEFDDVDGCLECYAQNIKICQNPAALQCLVPKVASCLNLRNTT